MEKVMDEAPGRYWFRMKLYARTRAGCRNIIPHSESELIYYGWVYWELTLFDFKNWNLT
jgi:hypothetical protein